MLFSFYQTEVKVEASAVKQLLEEGVGVDESEEVGLLDAGHAPIMIRGEDGVLYQVINYTNNKNKKFPYLSNIMLEGFFA